MSLKEAYLRITEEEHERSFVIADPRQDDMPIVFANDAFVQLTGYSRDEILGRNCRFLQGRDTNPETVCAMRESIAKGTDITVDILNYKKDGTPFYNRLRLRPIRSDNGDLQHIVGVQNPIEASEVRSKPINRLHD